MVNLEWYRTFKSVLKTELSQWPKSLLVKGRKSADINARSVCGYKLFNRKSKGVEPTEYAKLLNNLIIEARPTGKRGEWF
jgi:hypothetical protein